MELHQSHILKQLEREILPLQGLKKLRTDNDVAIDCDMIQQSFPDNTFPIGCTHEFITKGVENAASTNGFISALLSKLLKLGGVCLWISTTQSIFPVGLSTFNIHPDQIIFIHLRTEREVLYATEEALKCNKLTAVITEMKNISFKESRRFQLAAEESRVAGFIIRHQPKVIKTIASVSRWHVTSLPSVLEDGMPGIGFPRWKVELQKIRNGTPSTWIIEWSNNNFNIVKEKEEKIVWHEGLRMIS